MKIRTLGIILISLGAAVFIGFMARDLLVRQIFSPQIPENARQLLPITTPESTTPPETPAEANTTQSPSIEVLAENLEIPWEIAFLPDGDILVTERPGRILRLGSDRTAIPIQGVQHTGEGGLLGMALHPDFKQNNFIYLYLTTQTSGALTNRVERYELHENELTNRSLILENIPGATYHDGGRIAFGPDEMLYITTGDAGVEPNAQDTSSLAGKILRLTDEGEVPPDNPFNTTIYSYGHRNPQGLAWDASGNLWATEHGRSGAASGFDELNRIESGKNYGWPTIQGDETRAGMETPKAHSGASTTWAPSGMTFLNGNLLFAGLRGQSVYKAALDSGSGAGMTIIPYVATEFGRLRTITVGPDGLLYILTNNQDGRGEPRPGDDKLIRLNPSLFD